jgi:hypothetical protein
MCSHSTSTQNAPRTALCQHPEGESAHARVYTKPDTGSEVDSAHVLLGYRTHWVRHLAHVAETERRLTYKNSWQVPFSGFDPRLLLPWKAIFNKTHLNITLTFTICFLQYLNPHVVQLQQDQKQQVSWRLVQKSR